MDRWFGLPRERRRRGWLGLQEQRAEARAIARANILRDAEIDAARRSALVEPGTIVWRWDGRAWERWSDLWQAYEPGEVPQTLPDQLAAEGRSADRGDRYRFDGEAWLLLAPEDDERSQPPPGAAAAPPPAPPADAGAGAGGSEPTGAGDASGAGADPETGPGSPPGATPQPASQGETNPEPEPEPERPSTEEMLEAWRRRTRG